MDLQAYSLINVGDTVQLSHGGLTCSFKIVRINEDRIGLAYEVDNVAHIRWVTREQLLNVLYPSVG